MLPGTYKIIMDNDSKEIHNPSDMSYWTDGVCHFDVFCFYCLKPAFAIVKRHDDSK